MPTKSPPDKQTEELKPTELPEDESPVMHVGLVLRNLMVIAATALFLASIFIGHRSGLLKLIAYICGALAYAFEYLHLTDFLKKKIKHHELFMVYCFAPLYILMGLSYILHS